MVFLGPRVGEADGQLGSLALWTVCSSRAPREWRAEEGEAVALSLLDHGSWPGKPKARARDRETLGPELEGQHCGPWAISTGSVSQ